MRYECHVTVERFPTLEQILRFQWLCIQNRWKSLLIELSRGKVKLQLMAAVNATLDSDAAAYDWADKLVEVVRAAGFHVIRVKIESELSAGIADYYEAHWKFSPQWRGEFKGPEANMMLVSWNLVNGAAYLSKRYDYVGQSWQTVRQNFDGDHTWLRTMANVTPEKVHYERVIYDSARSLDDGWQGA